MVSSTLNRQRNLTELSFEIGGDPVPKARPRMTKTGHVYTPAKSRAWEIAVRVIAVEQLATIITEPCTGALRIDLCFYLRRGKTVKREHPSVKPDLDNLAKSVLDALNGVLYVDDAQIVELFVRKRYQTRTMDPGVFVFVHSRGEVDLWNKPSIREVVPPRIPVADLYPKSQPQSDDADPFRELS